MADEDYEVPDQPTIPEDASDEVIEGWSTATISGDRVNLFDAPIVAGTVGGARVEVAEDGLHAYDSTGAETAFIQGEGGEFVGGEFRTSDNLPGQVALFDQGYVDAHGGAYPGIRVSPSLPHNESRPPGIGSNENGMVLSGGTDASDNRAFAILEPELASLRSRNLTDGRDAQLYAQGDRAVLYASTSSNNRGEVRVDPTEANVRVIDEDNFVSARITAQGDTVTLFSATGGQRYLRINETGIWIEVGGEAYNLEETAQDSGWQNFPVKSEITASSDLSFRNKNGIIFFRGTFNASWAAGWTDVVTGLSDEIRPESDVVGLSPDSSDIPMIVQMTSTGTLRVYKQNAGSRTAYPSVISYPLG